MRYLAVDYGKKRTGLAICDEGERVVSPLTVLEGGKNLFERIAAIVRAEAAGAVVVGLPLNMDGTKGEQAAVVEEFGAELEKAAGVPVFFQDERLSSFAAQEKLFAYEKSRKAKAERLDAVAAALILEDFLAGKEAK